MKFLMIASFIYMFCFCDISLADVSDIVMEKDSIESEILLNHISILLNDPQSVESLKNAAPIDPIDMNRIDNSLIDKLSLLNKLFPLKAENLLSNLLNNHSNDKVRQMAAYLMGKWYQKEAPNKDHLIAASSLVNALEHPYWIIRVEAARALGKMKQGELQLFYWMKNEPKYEVRFAILESLYENTMANINRASSGDYNTDYLFRRLVELAEIDKDERIRIKALRYINYIYLEHRHKNKSH